MIASKNVRGAFVTLEHDRKADWDWLAAWQPAVIRYLVPGSFDDPRSVSVDRFVRLHDTCPEATLLARCWEADDNNGDRHKEMEADPVGFAQRQIDWWSVVIDNICAAGVPRDRLMAGLNNETPPSMDGALIPYTERALSIGTARGIRLGVWVFSTGRPSFDHESAISIKVFAKLDGAIRLNNGARILHEYMQPEGMYAVWTDEAGQERKDYGNLIGRHKAWPEGTPTIIGEWGIEGLLFNRHPTKKYGHSGWHNFPEWTPERYADEYVVCVTTGSPDVDGTCGYLSDNHDKRGTWKSFDMLEAYGPLLERKDLCVRPATTTLPDPDDDDKSVNVWLPSVTKTPGVPALLHPVEEPSYRGISQRFGENPSKYYQFGLAGHNGIDFLTPTGATIRAVDDGVVIQANSMTDYGIVIKILHPTWGESVYAHLQELLVQPMQPVIRGQMIGRSDNTGNSEGPHLHFAIRVNPYTRGWPYDGYSDPEPYLEEDDAVSPVLTVVSPNLKSLIIPIAEEFGLQWQLLAALSFVESRWLEDTTSDKGAKGVMQFMPDTWAEWSQRVGASDPFDATDSLRAGAAYLRYLIRYFAGSERRALWAYVWGMGRVGAGKVPPIEVTNYANAVLMARDLLVAIEA